MYNLAVDVIETLLDPTYCLASFPLLDREPAFETQRRGDVRGKCIYFCAIG
jgi:hypothetical protein